MGRRFRRLRLAAGAMVLAGSVATVGVVASAGTAAAGSLASLSWSVSNNEVSATGVTYTYTFKTATTGSIKSITMTVPTGTGKSTLGVTNAGIGAGSIALTTTNHELVYTVSGTTPPSVAAGTAIQLAVSGLDNPSTAGSDTSVVTTKSATATIDSATSPAVTFATSNTVVTVTVAESTTFTNSTTSFKLYMDPSFSTLSTQSKAVDLGVTTNAATGFTLSVKDTGLKIGATSHQITPVSSGAATAAGWPSGNGSRFGYSATLGGSDANATLATALNTSGNYAGYVTTGTGQTIVTDTAPTGTSACTLTLTNKVQIDYSTPAGKYSDTITYTVTPSY